MPANYSVLTKYEVLTPVSSAFSDGLYRSIGYVYCETEAYHSKTPEWIKDILVKSGEYPAGIRVITAK